MCGIIGAVGCEEQALKRGMELMAHRGPDAQGMWTSPEHRTVLGHNRLSILDLDPRSNQPFISEDEQAVLVFNGEIYNYLSLKATLEKRGIQFHTTSDTEVLLHWLRAFGSTGIADLDGMFAFAFFDIRKRKILFARDQIGEKPLYYAIHPASGKFAFASEIKGILPHSWIDKSLNTAALDTYLQFLYTAAPNTMYRGISELPPGHRMTLDLDEMQVEVEEYYNVERVDYLEPSGSISAFGQEFEQSVGLRLASDVPLCVYLSGGIDSNAILASASGQSKVSPIQTFTIGYAGSWLADHSDESMAARRSAEFFGANFSQVDFRLDSHLEGDLETIVSLFDQPFGNSTAIVANMLAHEVSKTHTVALVGDGGDEVAIGYPRQIALLKHQTFSRLPQFVRSTVSSVLQLVPTRGKLTVTARRLHKFAASSNLSLADAYLTWSTYLDSASLKKLVGRTPDQEFRNELLTSFARFEEDPLLAASIVDLKSFVPFNLMQSADRTSMANSLELRCPFLSTKVINKALSISGKNRYRTGVVKPIITDYLGGRLPPHVANAPKKPFNPPITDYLKSNIEVVGAILTGSQSRLGNVCDVSEVRRHLEDFQKEKRENATFLFGLLTLNEWLGT